MENFHHFIDVKECISGIGQCILPRFTNGPSTYLLVWTSDKSRLKAQGAYFDEIVYVGKTNNSRTRALLLLNIVANNFFDPKNKPERKRSLHGVDQWADELDGPVPLSDLHIILLFNNIPAEVERCVIDRCRIHLGRRPWANRKDSYSGFDRCRMPYPPLFPDRSPAEIIDSYLLHREMVSK